MENKQYREVLCPVCEDFYFSSLSDYEEKEHVDGHEFYCHKCGWNYSLEQLDNPDIKDNKGKTISDYKSEYQQNIKSNPSYYFQEENYKSSPHLCPVCKKT